MLTRALFEAMNGGLRKSLVQRFGRERLRNWLSRAGFDATHWVRVRAYRECHGWLTDIGLERLDVLEIAPGHYWQHLPFRSYSAVDLPEFDVCRDVLDKRFDLIIADQVFEHVTRPWTGARNVRAMLRPGGYFLIIVPFLLKVHSYPHDCTRWTETGLKWLLVDAGFDEGRIRTGSWGNRRCVIANLRRGWRMWGWGRGLRNEPEFPVMTWALAAA
jgi:SAM-dependent methyltransferase